MPFWNGWIQLDFQIMPQKGEFTDLLSPLTKDFWSSFNLHRLFLQIVSKPHLLTQRKNSKPCFLISIARLFDSSIKKKGHSYLFHISAWHLNTYMDYCTFTFPFCSHPDFTLQFKELLWNTPKKMKHIPYCPFPSQITIQRDSRLRMLWRSSLLS